METPLQLSESSTVKVEAGSKGGQTKSRVCREKGGGISLSAWRAKTAEATSRVEGVFRQAKVCFLIYCNRELHRGWCKMKYKGFAIGGFEYFATDRRGFHAASLRDSFVVL